MYRQFLRFIRQLTVTLFQWYLMLSTIHLSLAFKLFCHTHARETQMKEEKEDLPVHSQEHCTQKVGHPPFLQRACNVTVGEEKRRT